MAWQSPSAMNAGGANGGGDGNAPAGTEYTLQGKLHPWCQGKLFWGVDGS